MDQVYSTETEKRLRNAVAVCTRTLNHLGILGYSGHVSARLPNADQLIVQAFDQSRAQVTPDDLMVTDFDGDVVRGPVGAEPVHEVYIHTEILKARPDVEAVFHFHPDVATLFTMVDGIDLQPMKNHAMRWASGIPVHPVAAKIIDAEMGRAVADTLGGHHGMLLRSHGAVIVAENVEALMIDAIHFVENAETMYKAAMLGPVKPLTADEMAEIGNKTNRNSHVFKLWDYYTGNALSDGAIDAEWL